MNAWFVFFACEQTGALERLVTEASKATEEESSSSKVPDAPRTPLQNMSSYQVVLDD